jgi:hypothetical protein
VGCGVIGSPTGSGPVSLGSSPGTPASRLAPSSSGLGRRPLKAVAPVRIRSGLPLSTSATWPLTCGNDGQGSCCVSDGARSGPAVGERVCPFRARVLVSDSGLTAVRTCVSQLASDHKRPSYALSCDPSFPATAVSHRSGRMGFSLLCRARIDPGIGRRVQQPRQVGRAQRRGCPVGPTAPPSMVRSPQASRCPPNQIRATPVVLRGRPSGSRRCCVGGRTLCKLLTHD